MRYSLFCLLGVIWVHNPTFGQKKPNFIVIVADDLGYNDVGFNGSKEIYTHLLTMLQRPINFYNT